MPEKRDLKPHADLIVDMLARFKPYQEVSDSIAEDVSPEDIEAFLSPAIRKKIEKRSREIASDLPIVKEEYVMMVLNDIARSGDASVAERLSALRIRTAILKGKDVDLSAEDLVRDEE